MSLRGVDTYVGDTDAWQSSEHSGAQVWPACDIFGATKEEASDIAMRYGCDLVDPTHSRLLRHVLCYRCSSYTSDVTPVQLQGAMYVESLTRPKSVYGGARLQGKTASRANVQKISKGARKACSQEFTICRGGDTSSIRWS